MDPCTTKGSALRRERKEKRMCTVSDFVIDRLIEWDLHRSYGFPGDGIGGLDGALDRAEKDGKDVRYARPVRRCAR